MGQEFYPEYDEENEYYYQEGYNPYQNNNNDNNKNAPIVNIEKKIFICNNITLSYRWFLLHVKINARCEFPGTLPLSPHH